jgi:hypothetical protein
MYSKIPKTMAAATGTLSFLFISLVAKSLT